MDLIACQRIDKPLCRALDLALCIGILNAQIKYAAGLMREPLAYRHGEQPAEMHKAGRARREPRHLCLGRKLSMRERCLVFCRCHRNAGKQFFR